MFFRKNERGFTLLEMMLVALIITVLAVLSWAALTPTRHNYEAKATANFIAGAIRAARMRAISTGLCHQITILEGSADYSYTAGLVVPSGGWQVSVGNRPMCSDDGSGMNFGGPDILDVCSSSGGCSTCTQSNPCGYVSSMTSLGVSKPNNPNQGGGYAPADNTSTYAMVYYMKCCDRWAGDTANSCANAPTQSFDALMGGTGRNSCGLHFLISADGRIRHKNDAANYGKEATCTNIPSQSRYTIYIGARALVNNNYKVVVSDDPSTNPKTITSQQYAVTIDGNNGKVSVYSGW